VKLAIKKGRKEAVKIRVLLPLIPKTKKQKNFLPIVNLISKICFCLFFNLYQLVKESEKIKILKR